jgi:hypothetical protein
VRRIALALAALLLAPAGLAAPAIDQPAPDFTVTDSQGKPVSLSELRGHPVVLEWSNDGCPYVRKWYGSGAMQRLQRDAVAKGAVWLTVISSAPGEQGYVDGAGADADTRARNAAPSHVLLDPTGALGHLYDALATPHIFVIRADGTLGYMGGVDSIASTDIADIAKAEPYAREAVDAIASGRKVPHPVTRPYGCSVKYAG